MIALAGCDFTRAPQQPRAAPSGLSVQSDAESPNVAPPGTPAGNHGRYGVSAQAAFFALGDTTTSISKDPSPFRFRDIRPESGVDFVHVSGNDNRKLYPTAFGSGVAVFDYDGDGKMDLYFATCNPLPLSRDTFKISHNRLYQNVGAGRFQDVTASSGLGFAGFCHGIIVGDVENDGDQDVFLCNFGSNVLYINNGDGTFRDVSRAAGIDRPNWSSGGAMLDYDNDGDLDIYIANYGDWIYPRDAHCCGTERVPLFCSPWDVRAAKHILYRNNGDGTFTDVTDKAGIGKQRGRGFGVVAADFNGDGRTDLYVANDLNPNFLFLNRGDGTFEDATESSGAAYDERGIAQSSMGVDAEDCDGDRFPELFVSNFQNEHIGYYENLSASAAPQAGGLAPALFRESSAAAGLFTDSKPWVGWGCALADFDNDGWPDGFVANGHVDANRHDLAPMMTYVEPPLLYRNVSITPAGTHQVLRHFQLSTRDVGAYFNARHAARGAAFGDLDDDGDLDIVVSHMDGRRPSCAMIRRIKTRGFVSHWSARGAIVTRSVHASKSPLAGAPSHASARAGVACSRPTIRDS